MAAHQALPSMGFSRQEYWSGVPLSSPSNKEPLANSGVRDMGSIPGLGRSPGGGHGNPLQYSCLENPMDREACWATIYRVPESWTWLKWLSTQASRFSSTICKTAVLFPLNCLGTLVKNHWATYANSLFLDFLFYSIHVCICVCVCVCVCVYASTTLCMVNCSLTRMPRQFNGEIIVLLINDIGTIEYPHTKEWDWIVAHTISKY